jgi:hypothetical protein
MSLLSAAEFKQAYLEAEVTDMLTIIGGHLTKCIEELSGDEDFSLDVTKTSKQAMSIVVSRLASLGYKHVLDVQGGERWLRIITPEIDDVSGVDTTIPEKEGKKRKTQV